MTFGLVDFPALTTANLELESMTSVNTGWEQMRKYNDYQSYSDLSPPKLRECYNEYSLRIIPNLIRSHVRGKSLDTINSSIILFKGSQLMLNLCCLATTPALSQLITMSQSRNATGRSPLLRSPPCTYLGDVFCRSP